MSLILLIAIVAAVILLGIAGLVIFLVVILTKTGRKG